jgi:hypothetical protein
MARSGATEMSAIRLLWGGKADISQRLSINRDL